MEKRYLNEKEVSELTGRALPTLRADRHYGRGLPYIKLGKQIRYEFTDVVEHMDANKIRPEINDAT